MSGRIRINVKFGDTKVLVPVGEGNITVEELISKAIEKFRKVKKLHEDDQVLVSNLRQEDDLGAGSYIDRDDDVVDVLDDKETVVLEFKLIPHDAPPGYDPDNRSSPDLSNSSVPTTSSSAHLHNQGMMGDQLYSHNSSSFIPARPSSTTLSGVSSNELHHLFQYPRFEHENSVSSLPQYASNGQLAEDTKASQPEARENISQMSFDEVHIVPGGLSQVQDENQLEFPESSGEQNQSQVPMTLEDGSHVATVNSQKQSMGSYDEIHSHPSPAPPTSSTPVIPTTGGGGGVGRLTSMMGGEQVGVVYPNNYVQRLELPTSRSNMSDYLQQDQRYSFNNNSRSLPMNMLHDGEPLGVRGTEFDPAFSPGHSMYQSRMRGSDGFYPPHHYYNSGSQTDPFHQPPPPPDSASSIKSASSYFFPNERPLPGGRPLMSNHTMPGSGAPGRYSQSPMQGYSHGTFPPDRALPPSAVDRPMYSMDEYHSYIHQQLAGEHPAEHMRRRRVSGNEHPSYDDHFTGGRGRGSYNRPQPMRQWNRHLSTEDDRYTHTHGSLRGGSYDDQVQDYRLSQPAPYLHTQYSYPMRRGGGGGGGSGHLNMLGGRMGGVSGLSLSQPEPGMRPSLRPPYTPPKGVLKNKKEQSPRGDVWRHGYGGDRFEEADEDEEGGRESVGGGGELEPEPSPFQRNARKSMFRDSYVYGVWQEKYENMDYNENEDGQIPEWGGSQSQSQPTSSPALSEDEDEDDDDIRVVVLERGDQPLGIHLVSYTAMGKDLGVFIAAIDKNGFAASSGQLQVSDRILACNGEDFTDEDNAFVEHQFKEMASSEPILKIAVSRGHALDFIDNEARHNDSEHENWKENRETEEPDTDRETSAATNDASPSVSSPPATANAPLLTSVTNTRLIGVRHKIELQRGERGLGFGLSSRDVLTNDSDHPIYVKCIHSEGPAFQDGRLKLGDRILEVNGVSVKGKSQSEVANLLRSSDHVSLVVSRQEIIDMQDEFPDSAELSAVPTSVGKSLLTFNIPLTICGVDGLGVKVHGRYSNARHQSGDMGIYIKFIEPNGAAARHGQLKKNDQLLSVNGQSLLNLNNRDALDTLKKALSEASLSADSVIQLTVARAAGINRKTSLTMSSYSSQMAALQEEEERLPDADREGDSKKDDQSPREVGIDCPPEKKLPSAALRHSRLSEPQDSPYHHRSHPPSPNHLFSASSSSSSSTSSASPSTKLYYHKPKETSPHPLASGDRGSSRRLDRETSPSLSHGYSEGQRRLHYDGGRKELKREQSSESRERAIDVGPTCTSPQRHSMSPAAEWAVAVFDSDSHSSSLDCRDGVRSSGVYPRSSSVHSDLSSSHSPTISASSINRGLRDSLRRTGSPPYDTLENKTQRSSTSSSSSAQGRSHHHAATLPSNSSGQYSPRVAGDSNTLPRSRGRKDSETTSLNSYNSESDLMNPFQRDDKNRRSIPKNKKNQQPRDFGYLQYAKFDNMEPQIEDDSDLSSPLYRTGSDGDLSAIATPGYSEAAAMMASVPVGPNLRLAKSSSLESLQTAMHYTIRANVDNDGGNSSLLRNRTTRNSFHRAVDRSLDTGSTKNGIGSPALMSSLTKSPGKKKNKNKLITWFIKKRKGKKEKSESGGDRKSRASMADFDFSEESIEELARKFGITEAKIRQMGTHSGKLENQEKENEEEEEDDDDDDDDSILQTKSQV